MEHVLVISAKENICYQLADTVAAALPATATLAFSGQEARYLSREHNFAVALIQAPLSDEFGHSLAEALIRDTAAGVIMLCPAPHMAKLAEPLANCGIITLAQGMEKAQLHQALKLAYATHIRLKGLEKERHRLARKLDDIKLVEKAKYTLMQVLKMSEAQAHDFIVRQAMNMRISQREVAEGILRTYVI